MTITIKKKIELIKANDYRDFGATLNKYMESMLEKKYGKYKITEEQKPYFLVLSCMHHFQQANNRGIRFVGDYGTLQVELFDIEERQRRLDEAMDDWSL